MSAIWRYGDSQALLTVTALPRAPTGVLDTLSVVGRRVREELDGELVLDDVEIEVLNPHDLGTRRPPVTTLTRCACRATDAVIAA